MLDRIQFWKTSPSYDAVMEDEQLMSKESDELHNHFRALQKSQRRLKRWITALVVLLCLALLSLAVAVANTSYIEQRKTAVLSPVPPLPFNTKVTFERDESFAGPSTPERDENWSLMMPAGDGFITISNDTYKQYGLPLGKSTTRGQVYDTSLFHQLHCLNNIRIHLYTMQAAIERNNTEQIVNMLLRPQDDHVYHCFDYIRQALMCQGDMTIEWPRTEKDGRRFAVDGWGITHQCRNWDSIMQFMDENSVANQW